MKNLCILGGGLSGLVALRELETEGFSPLLFEKEKTPGGLCRSIEKDSFVFDYTGHLFHASREETRDYIDRLGLWDKLTRHERKAAIFIEGRVTPYPIQINTWGLAPEIRRDCLLGSIRAWAAEVRDPANFRQWVLARFGEGLARHFFFPYNEKLYRIACEDLSLDWVGRYVPKPDLEEVVDGAMGLHPGGAGYNAHFHYPCSGGIRMLPEAVAAGCSGLRMGRDVRGIHLRDKYLVLADGERVDWSRLLVSFSLPVLMDMLLDELPSDILEGRKNLRWVQVLNVALGVEGPPPTDQHWLYFPSPKLPFYRVGFPSNHAKVAPEGCHTVSIEISLDPGEFSPLPIAEQAEKALADIGFLKPERIRTRVLTKIDPAYVVFDHQRSRALSLLRSFLNEHGVFLNGRWAEWKYSAMEDAILDGVTAARRILNFDRD